MSWSSHSVLLVTAAALAQVQSPLARLAGPPFDAGAGPYGGVLADFNNDGVPDLAFAAYGISSVTILLGDGRGGFTPAPGSPFRAGAQTLNVITGDFNGDGVVDVVSLNTLAGPMFIGQGQNTVMLGDGKGGFSFPIGSPGQFAVPSQLTRGFPIDFAGADLNGDGKTDLVMRNGNGIWALLSDGTGGFNIAPGSPFTTDNSGMALADFNGDGLMDVAVSSAAKHSVTVYFGDGAGGFREGKETVLGAGFVLSTLIAADWNGDRVPDLAVSAGDAGILILAGDRSGAFQLRSLVPAAVKYARQPFCVADFNGDGYPDLCLSNGSTTELLFGDGAGSFTPGETFTGENDLGFAIAGDLNGDGKPDLAFSKGSVWLNTLQTIPVSRVSLEFRGATGGPAPKPVLVNAGGISGLTARSDQSWAQFANGQVAVDTAGLTPGHRDAKIRLSAPGYFGALIRVSLDLAAQSGILTFHAVQPEPLLPLGDFNHDGKLDLLRLNGGSLTIRLNKGGADFTEAGQRFPLTLGIGGSALGDFDGDGNLDVAVVGQNGIAFYAGDGKGALRPGRLTNIKTDASAFQLEVADFNGDGFLDIAAASSRHEPLQIFLGDGRGNFRELLNSGPALPPNPAQIVVGDFNNDGIPDLAISEYRVGNVYLLLNDGSGRFTLSQTLSFGANGFTSIAVGDWNNDGNLDLVVRNWRSNTDTYLTFFSGDGQGQLTKSNELFYPKPRLVGAVVSADVDGDGNMDILIGLDDQTVMLLLGDGKGGFAPSPGGPVGKGYNALPADLNGDGLTDVLIRGLDQFAILLGGPAPTSVALTRGEPNPFTVGQILSLTATVATAPGAFRAPSGMVSLYDGSTLVSTVPLRNGAAVFNTNYVPGTHRFRAVYNGDARSASSEGLLTVVEAGAPTAIHILGSAQPFRVVVTDANHNPVSGVGVVFTAPVFGPSGSFATGSSALALTDSEGVATAPVFTPNAYPGPFAIAVTNSGYPNLSAAIPLRN